MRLATFKVNGRVSYGVVTAAGIVDLGRKLAAKYPSLLDLIRAQSLAELSLRFTANPIRIPTGGEASSAAGELASAAAPAPDHGLDEVEFLPPLPGGEKIICVGINYADRNAEYKDNRQASKYPNLFVRFPGSFVGHEQSLVRPRASEKLDYEGEIVLVIGREGRNVPRERALGMIAGLTLANEGTIRDWVRHGTLNVTQGKNFDRSGSIGPWIVTADEIDPGKPLHLTTRVNGEIRQDDSTARLIWDFSELIRYITMFTTLKAGDLILTGTPTGSGSHADPPVWLKPGDVLEVEVPEIGVLRNTVVDET
jgi:2-keto-4-pentenoate hydratase/2-oxohepta-3-ene-1,7-dioic acid hydratase in catechol pathway